MTKSASSPKMRAHAAVFMEHMGVTIYHAFRNGNPQDHYREYIFTTDPSGDETKPQSFDVRDLDESEMLKQAESARPSGELGLVEWTNAMISIRNAVMSARRTVIRNAIEAGRIKGEQ